MLRAPFTLQQLAEATGSQLVGDPNHIITNISDLDSATSTDVSFLAKSPLPNVSYEKAMLKSAAGAVFVSPDTELPSGRNFLIHMNPSQTFQKVVAWVYSEKIRPSGFSEGVHPSAVVHESAKLGAGVVIGPNCVVDCGAEIGAGTKIGPCCSIGVDTKIGEGCLLYPNVVIRERCVVGNRVILQPGAVVGSCGYGYVPNEKGHHIKLEQLGDVVIEDDVEIGANTTIDRARFKTTRIRRGTKIDNLVQVAHGVDIGEDNLIIGQTGFAGSCKTGRHVIIAGQTGVNGHIEICDNVIIGAKSGVVKSIGSPGTYVGNPVQPVNEAFRQGLMLRKIESYVKRISELEKRLDAMEKGTKVNT
jgi:UDP-3-O-[3-hydroxymyristoyl] glucosamine N-acyltransferase